MERQFIFFRTGRALLIFSIGIVTIIAGANTIAFFFPEESGWAFLVVTVLAVIVILVSFKKDERSVRELKVKKRAPH